MVYTVSRRQTESKQSIFYSQQSSQYISLMYSIATVKLVKGQNFCELYD